MAIEIGEAYVQVKGRLDRSSFERVRTQIQFLLARAEEEIDIQVELEAGKFHAQRRLLEAHLARLDAKSIDIGVRMDRQLDGDAVLITTIMAAIAAGAPAIAAAGAGMISLGAGLVAVAGGGGLFLTSVLANIIFLRKTVEKDLTEVWKKFGLQTRESLMRVADQVVAIANNLLPKLVKATNAINPAIAHVARQFANWVDSPGFDKTLAWFQDNAPRAIKSLGVSLGNIGVGFGGIIQAFTPMMHTVLGGVERLTARFAAWGQNLAGSSGFAKFIDWVLTHWPLVSETAKNLMGAVRNLGVGLSLLAPQFLPVLNAVTGWMATMSPQNLAKIYLLITGMRILSHVSSTTAAVVNQLRAGGELLQKVFGKLGKVVGGALTAVRHPVTTLGKGVGLLGKALAFLVSPIGIVLAAIGLLVGAFVMMWRESEAFRNAVKAVWDALKQLGDAILGVIAPILEQFGIDITSFTDAVKGGAKGMGDALAVALEQVAVWIEQAAAWVEANGPRIVEWVKRMIDKWREIQPTLAAIVQFLANVFTGNWSAIWQQVLTKARQVWDDIKQAVKTRINEAVQAVLTRIGQFLTTWQTRLNDIRSRASTAWANIRSAATTAWSNIVSAITTRVTNAVTRVRTGFTNAVAAVRSRVSAAGAAARAWIGAVISGIQARVGQIRDRVRNAINNAITAVRNGVSRMVSAGRALVQGIAQGIRNGAAAVANAARNAAVSAFNAAKRALGIGSPSKLFRDEVGAQMMAGAREGVEAAARSLADATARAMPAPAAVPVGAAAARTATPAAAPMNVTINLTGVWEFTDPLAHRRVVRTLHDALTRYQTENR